jgi:NADPH:quinone reductase-like Zn-dependent oxidoreductase
LTCGLAEDEFPAWTDILSGLGHTLDGTLREYGVFHKTSLVKMPPSLNFLEAATLTCSGLTAWNALFGLDGKGPGVGSTVLVQGTGGVSIAALQFATATGATVIATTSSNEKVDRLKSLGASHVINYRETADWGEAIRGYMTNGKGVDVVVDVGGPSTLQQSLRAVRKNGVISASGLLGDSPDGKVPTILDCVFATCIARGILLGSRKQFHDMNQFVEEFGIKPVLDSRVFDFGETKQAYTFMSERRHFSKVVIRFG